MSDQNSARPVRTVILCNSPDNGGGANLLFRVTKYMDQGRVRPTLYLHADGWQAQQQRLHGCADVVIDSDFAELAPVPPLAAGTGAFLKAVVRTAARTRRAVSKLRRLILERQIHVVGGFGNFPAAVATMAGTLTGRPVIWSAQRCYNEIAASIPMQGVALAPAVRRIFAVSRAASAPYWAVPEKVVIAYNGVDPDDVDPAKLTGTLRRRHGLAADVPLVGIAGRVIHLKGLDIFLRAAGRLAAKHPRAKFVIIGRREGDAFDRELDRLVSAEKLEGRVIFTGWVEDIRTEILDLDVQVIASRRDAAPLVAYEGMALGRPIVATLCPGLDEQMQDGVSGLYVPREDPESMAAAVDKLLSDPRLRRSLGAAARQVVCDRFNIRSMVGRVEETIVRLAKDPHAALDGV